MNIYVCVKFPIRCKDSIPLLFIIINSKRVVVISRKKMNKQTNTVLFRKRSWTVKIKKKQFKKELDTE